MKHIVLFLIGSIWLCACSGSSHQTKSKFQRDVLTEEEIQNTSATNAYELIQRKRPEFLRPQGPKAFMAQGSSSRLPVVYLNGTRYGYPEDLQKLPAELVKEVRYLNEVDANLQFGIGNVAGAILVTTRK